MLGPISQMIFHSNSNLMQISYCCHPSCSQVIAMKICTSRLLYSNRDNQPSVSVNSFVPGKFKWNFRDVIVKRILVTDGWHISCEIALIWMSMDFTDNQSTLVQGMAWCHQATSHYLSQCWPDPLRHMALLGHNELSNPKVEYICKHIT